MKLTFDPLELQEAERLYEHVRTEYVQIGGDPRFLSTEDLRRLDNYVADLFRVISSPAAQQGGKTDGTLWYRAAELQKEIIEVLGYD